MVIDGGPGCDDWLRLPILQSLPIDCIGIDVVGDENILVTFSWFVWEAAREVNVAYIFWFLLVEEVDWWLQAHAIEAKADRTEEVLIRNSQNNSSSSDEDSADDK